MNKTWKTALEILSVLLVAVLVAVFVQAFFIRAFVVPTCAIASCWTPDCILGEKCPPWMQLGVQLACKSVSSFEAIHCPVWMQFCIA